MAAQGHGLPLIVPSVPTGRHFNAVNHCKIERPGNQNKGLKQVTGAVTEAVADLLGVKTGGPNCVCLLLRKKKSVSQSRQRCLTNVLVRFLCPGATICTTSCAGVGAKLCR